MKLSNNNIFLVPCDAICITTNGAINSKGEAVMGRGCAYTASQLDRTIPTLLARKIKESGNIVHTLKENNGVWLVSFPVKAVSEPMEAREANVVKHMHGKFDPNKPVPGWACKARTTIIEESCRQLVELVDTMKWTNVLVPAPGCGAGELKWDDVKLVLEKYFDDRFTVCFRAF